MTKRGMMIEVNRPKPKPPAERRSSHKHSRLRTGRYHGERNVTNMVLRVSWSEPLRRLIHDGLPRTIHCDDIVHGRIDADAVWRRERADTKRLIEASRKPYRPAPKCNHARPVKSHIFTDGKILKLYACGCSNGREVLRCSR